MNIFSLSYISFASKAPRLLSRNKNMHIEHRNDHFLLNVKMEYMFNTF